jgi:signal transduction histidine kinase
MRRRIIICLGLLFGMCLLGDVIAMVWLGRSMRTLSALVESHRIQLMRVELNSAGLQIETDLLALLAGRGHTAADQSEHAIQFTRSMNRCQSCHHAPGLEARLDHIHKTFGACQEATARLSDGSDPRQAPVLQQEALDIANDLVMQTTRMADEAGRHLAVEEEDVAGVIRNAGAAVGATLLVLLVCSGLVAFHLMRSLTRPVAGLLAGIERVRKGDSSYRFPVDTDPEFRRLAETFNKAYADLRRAHEGMLQAEKLAAVGRLAAGVAHDVLNPLASASAQAQLARRRCTSVEQAEHIDLATEEIDRTCRIVREIMSFSQPAADETHKSLDIRALLEHAVTLVGHDPRARNINITCDCDSQIRNVRGDSDRLLMAFTNVMINAIDAINATDNENGTLAIAAKTMGDRAVLVFRDSGPGLSEEAAAHAFEPFFTTKSKAEGTGLGLWICYQVIHTYGGSIRIDSAVREGATVTIELPCEPEAPLWTR